MGLNRGFKKMKKGKYKKIKIGGKPPWKSEDYIAIEGNTILVARDPSPKRAREKAIARGATTPRVVSAKRLNSNNNIEFQEHPQFDY